MQSFLSIEESEKSLPVLLLFGYTKNIREELVRLNSEKFRIIIVGSKKPNFLDDYQNAYFISYKKADLLLKLEEKVDYAIAFLSDDLAIKNIGYFTEKSRRDHAKVLGILRTESIDHDLKNIDSVKILSDVRLCILGEILSSKSSSESDLSKIIENAIINQKIVLDGREEQSVFCISLSDATTAIQRLLFGNFKKENLYYLFYKNPQTILDAVYTIARVEPDTKIIFSENTKKSNTLSREKFVENSKSKTLMDSSYIDSLDGFEKTIEGFFNNKQDFEKSNRRWAKKNRRKNGGPVSKAFKFSLISFGAGLLLFIFLNFLFFGIGLLFLRQSISDLENGNFSNAATNAKKSNFLLEIIKPTIEVTFDLISAVDQQGQTQQTYRLLRKAGELSEISGSTITDILKSANISENQILSSLASFSFIFQEGQRIQSKTQNKSLSNELKSTYSNLLSLSQVLPQVMGFEKEMNYLLLFQNNEELRPTGGFIGSIGEMVLEKGQIKDINIQDVYELDGQLKHHIDPPFVVRRYLQPHLYLRDSNFPLDFQEVASSSAFIYNLESGKEPQAVIAIDLEVLKEILKITGPINLPNYNVTVDDTTISQFLQSTIKDNFFPGSTQKKDVLNTVFHKLVDKTKNDQKFNVALLKLLPDLLEKKHILISFSDSSIQKVFNANNYSGSYGDTRKVEDNTIYDYLYVNEANIGVNKVNALVSRTIEYRAMIGQDSLVSIATLSLTNASKIDDYKTYLTFVVPANSTLQKITIDGVEQVLTQAIVDPQTFESSTFVEPQELEVEQYSKNNLNHISFVTIVPKNKKTNIKVEYSNGASKKVLNATNYSLLLNSQPGVAPYTFKSIFDYPEEYVPKDVNATTYGSNFFEKEFTIDDNLIFEFQLQKKTK